MSGNQEFTMIAKASSQVITFSPEHKIDGKKVEDITFRNKYATVSKGQLDLLRKRSTYGKSYALEGEHNPSWLTDQEKLKQVKSEAIRLGIPVADLEDMKSNIRFLKETIKQYDITPEEIKASGKTPFEFVDGFIAETKSIIKMARGGNALELLKKEADELGISYMPNIKEVSLKKKIEEHLAKDSE